MPVRPKNETEFTNHIRVLVEKRGGFFFKVHGHAMQKNGMPDYRISSPLWCGWIEGKYESNETSAIQKIQLAKLNHCSDPAFVLRYRKFDNDPRLFLEDKDGNLLKVLVWDTLTGESLLVSLWVASVSIVKNRATQEQMEGFAERCNIPII